MKIMDHVLSTPATNNNHVLPEEKEVNVWKLSFWVPRFSVLAHAVFHQMFSWDSHISHIMHASQLATLEKNHLSVGYTARYLSPYLCIHGKNFAHLPICPPFTQGLANPFAEKRPAQWCHHCSAANDAAPAAQSRVLGSVTPENPF